MFDGTAPDAWLVPWVSDATFGLLVPFIVFLAIKGKSIRAWGLLVVYNALGAFDYVIGLATQWQNPLSAEIAPAQTVYLGIGLFLILQLTALGLLWRKDVIQHFISKL